MRNKSSNNKISAVSLAKVDKSLLTINEDSLPSCFDQMGMQTYELQEKLAAEIKDRKAERMIWVTIVAFLFTCLLFDKLNGWLVSLVVFPLEIIVLLLIANYLEVDYAVRLFAMLNNKFKNKDC